MKDDFAQCFRENRADAVLLDSVPFFSEISAESVDLTFLGHLSRFVNFVDAIHDCQLPLLIRGTQPYPLDAQTAGSQLLPVLTAYDQRTGGHYGQAAWIEWTRCLSRLRSREAINAQVRPLVVCKQ
jgi:predicted ATPase